MKKFTNYLTEAVKFTADKNIPHIEHVHQLHPNKEGEKSAHFSMQVLHHLDKNLRGEKSSAPFITTGKVDDKISTKIQKHNGKISVGYKGATAPLMSTQQEIDHHYAEKPHVHSALSHLLQHAHKIIPAHEDNVRYQVGLIHSGDSDKIKRIDNGSVTPNTIEYQFHNPKEGAKIGVSIVSKSELSKHGHPVSIHQNFDANAMGTHKDVEVIDNKINFSRAHSHYSPSSKADFQHHMTQAQHLHNQMKMDNTHSILAGHTDSINAYHNSLIKSGIEPTADVHQRVKGYANWLRYKGTEEASKAISPAAKQRKLNAANDQANHVETHSSSFAQAFQWMHHTKQAAQSLTPALSKAGFSGVTSYLTQPETGHRYEAPGEGVVVSTQSPKGHMYAVKVVPHDFTAANFAKSAQFKK